MAKYYRKGEKVAHGKGQPTNNAGRNPRAVGRCAHLPQTVNGDRPINDSLNPFAGNVRTERRQRPGDGSSGIGVAAAVQKGLNRFAKIALMQIIGIECNRNTMIGIARNAPLQTHGSRQLGHGFAFASMARQARNAVLPILVPHPGRLPEFNQLGEWLWTVLRVVDRIRCSEGHRQGRDLSADISMGQAGRSPDKFAQAGGVARETNPEGGAAHGRSIAGGIDSTARWRNSPPQPENGAGGGPTDSGRKAKQPPTQAAGQQLGKFPGVFPILQQTLNHHDRVFGVVTHQTAAK